MVGFLWFQNNNIFPAGLGLYPPAISNTSCTLPPHSLSIHSPKMLEHPTSTFKQATWPLQISKTWTAGRASGSRHPPSVILSQPLSHSQPLQPALPPSEQQVHLSSDHISTTWIFQIISPSLNSQHLLHKGNVLLLVTHLASSLFHIFLNTVVTFPCKFGYYLNNNIYLIAFVLFYWFKILKRLKN